MPANVTFVPARLSTVREREEHNNDRNHFYSVVRLYDSKGKKAGKYSCEGIMVRYSPE
jgi:hypothetical protein